LTKIIEHSPDSFANIMKYVESFQEKREFSWYRGTGNSSYSLAPTLTRKFPTPSPEDLRKVEHGIANSFSQRSPPFINTEFTSEWKMLFYMQHYSIPTRLLDWSESPFVGLYFALTSVNRDGEGNPLNDVALWLCDPVAWNRTALSHISFSGGILDETCEEIKAYSPSAEVDQRATIPIMIYGTHNSPRIVAQRGVFSLFGKGLEGMEKTFLNGAFAAGSLERIVIKQQYINKILASLHRKGFAESTIYPDLFGLSLEIKRSFGYH
jgi:hypothetical protein